VKATLVYLDGRRVEVETPGARFVIREELPDAERVRTAETFFVPPTYWHRMFGPLRRAEDGTREYRECAFFREDMYPPARKIERGS
jgi:hypothetical protein